MIEKFQTPASINKIETLADRTLKLTVYCSRELPPEEMQKIFSLNSKEGWFLFSENTFQTKDVPTETAKIDQNVKTPSKRLYAVLFVRWNNETDQKGNFNQWRENEMERIIEFEKSKLPTKEY